MTMKTWNGVWYKSLETSLLKKTNPEFVLKTISVTSLSNSYQDRQVCAAGANQYVKKKASVFSVLFQFLLEIHISSLLTFEGGKGPSLPGHTTASLQHIAANPPSGLLGTSARLSRLISGFAEFSLRALRLTSSVAFVLFPSLSESHADAPLGGVQWFLSASALNNWCLDCLGIHGHKKAFPSLCLTHCRNLKSSSPVARRSGKQVM